MPIRSFRTRFILLVLVAAVLPLGLLGLWLRNDVARRGEALLRQRLAADVDRAAGRIAQRWMAQRAELLDLSETDAVRQALDDPAPISTTDADGTPTIGASDLLGAGAGSSTSFELVALHDLRDRAVLNFAESDPLSGLVGASIPVALPVHRGPVADRIGTLHARLRVDLLLPTRSAVPGGIGAVLGLYEPDTRAALSPLPFDLPDPTLDVVAWGGEQWLLASRTLAEPPLLLVAAAPTSPFAAPFRDAARQGTLLLAVAGLIALGVAVMMTTRMTRSLHRLAVAADAVAAGDLDVRIAEPGHDEVGRAARAFNSMTARLESTLQQLADHRALAAVGEFAASLAHEIRNPLSAVRLDLQVVEEELPPESSLRRLQKRALAEIQRMDATLAGALQTARSGRHDRNALLLWGPLDAAAEAARAAVGERGATIGHADVDVASEREGTEIRIHGDEGALRQLFLNLLLNAAQAAGEGGRVTIAVALDAKDAVVSVADDGPGVPAELRGHVFDPLVSGRPGGTGLGLSIADRIARAHGGSIELADHPDGGTIARVRLPVAAAEPGADRVGQP